MRNHDTPLGRTPIAPHWRSVTCEHEAGRPCGKPGCNPEPNRGGTLPGEACGKRWNELSACPDAGYALSAMSKRVYLAGPEVFLSDAREIGARKCAICRQHSLIGVFPTDEDDAYDPALAPTEQGLAISRAMERLIQGCDAMIVNLTPFRGPSTDVGSAYEMGFMRALGRPIFAYSNDDRPFQFGSCPAVTVSSYT